MTDTHVTLEKAATMLDISEASFQNFASKGLVRFIEGPNGNKFFNPSDFSTMNAPRQFDEAGPCQARVDWAENVTDAFLENKRKSASSKECKLLTSCQHDLSYRNIDALVSFYEKQGSTGIPYNPGIVGAIKEVEQMRKLLSAASFFKKGRISQSSTERSLHFKFTCYANSVAVLTPASMSGDFQVMKTLFLQTMDWQTAYELKEAVIT